MVRTLLKQEGFPPHRVVLVVNGDGGLDDEQLEASVRTIRLPVNTGPAGGFRAGLLAAFEDPETRWAYLCEDDVGLFDLPTPRVSDVLERLEKYCGEETESVGAVVAYGRRFVGRGNSVNVVPEPGAPPFVPVDVAAWGATLVARTVVERGVLPAPEWFFGYEDFDFFSRVRASGLRVLLDSASARCAARVQTSAGREAALSRDRPGDAEEPWRAYYVARELLSLGPGPRLGELAGLAHRLLGAAPTGGLHQSGAQGDAARSHGRLDSSMGTASALRQDNRRARPSDVKEVSSAKTNVVLPHERKGAMSGRDAEGWVVGSHVGHDESENGRPVLRQEAL